MRVLLAGDEAAAVQVLRGLDQSPHTVAAVMAPDRQSVTGTTVAGIARAAGLPTWPSEWVQDPALADRLRDERVDVVLNVHSLYKVEATALDAPRYGWFNLHPGLLPDYAGMNTTMWAICRGEAVHGVTVHRMVSAIDAGPIAYEERFPIEETDTGLTLSSKCTRVGARLMLDLVTALADDPASVPARAQEPSALHYYRRDERPVDGPLDWNQPAAVVSRIARAYDYYPLASPWGELTAMLRGQEVGISRVAPTSRRTPARPGDVEPTDGNAILVACADEWVRVGRVTIDGQTSSGAALMGNNRGNRRTST